MIEIDKIDIFNSCCKMFIINFFTYFMILIILGLRNNNLIKTLIIILISIAIGGMYGILIQVANSFFALPIIYLVNTVIIKLLIRKSINYSLFIANISIVMTYITYLSAVLIVGTLIAIIYPKINYNKPQIVFLFFAVMLLIYYALSKTRRLKNGINFLKNIKDPDKISILINIISILLFIAFIVPNMVDNITLNIILIILIIVAICSIIYWIKSQITKYYKKNMKDRTIEIQKLEIDENQKIIEEIKEENLKLAEVVHKYNNRLSAVEMALEDAINKNINTEFSNELSIILDETKELTKNFAKESAVNKIKLPQTNISGIDNMFKYMQKEATEHKINFDLKLNNSIHNLIENTISKDKLETILGDHLRDAIIAIDNSNCTYRSILVTLGIIENCYELSIYDTGIEFEIDTLLKLGKERITTHKDTGGNGIGFMTTFETLKETKASLIIEEYNPKDSNYTKSINIRFDGKNEYKIYSYRVEEIKKQNKDKKIIIYGI